MVIFGAPLWERATRRGEREEAGARRGYEWCEQNRNTGVHDTREGRRRKLADESRSGSTRRKVVVRDQPSTAATIRSSFSLFFLLFFYFLFSYCSFRVLCVFSANSIESSSSYSQFSFFLIPIVFRNFFFFFNFLFRQNS